jgi:uncharacterized protein YbjT (DUF2867 family)
MTAHKLAAEEAIRACGVPYTIFCPTWPMEMLPRYARSGPPLMIGDQPLPAHWFAADDLARMISNAYRREEVPNRKLFVHGPEAMTTVEALERYCRAFHPEVESVPLMPIEAVQATAASTGNQKWCRNTEGSDATSTPSTSRSWPLPPGSLAAASVDTWT